MQKKGFELKTVTDCGTVPYQLLSPTLSCGDLVNHNPVV